MHTDTTAPAAPAPACTGFPGACGAAAGQPCEPGCPSRATDDYAAMIDDSDPERDDDGQPHRGYLPANYGQTDDSGPYYVDDTVTYGEDDRD